ncbi:hypothetical protein ACHAWU_006245 [Discostella pseudostelligera]|uniref:Uncharacterized protein n=1 Tax=Discostella pseudostelligera TaxID=259834 RepID=A0ABD3MLW8_9STRA
MRQLFACSTLRHVSLLLLLLHHAIAAAAVDDEHAVINHSQPDLNDNNDSRSFQNILAALPKRTTSNNFRGRHLQPDSDITDQSTAAAAAAHINIFDAGSNKNGNSTSTISSSSSGGKSNTTSTISSSGSSSGAKSQKQQPNQGNTASPTPKPSRTKMPVVGGKSTKIPKNGNTVSPTSSHTKMPVQGKASKGKAKSGKGSKAGGKSGKAGPGPLGTVEYKTSFEDGKFPVEPWLVSSSTPGGPYWAITTDAAAYGIYSIKTPTFVSANTANVTISIPQSWNTPGRLIYYVRTPMNFTI